MKAAFISDLHANLRLPQARLDAGGVSSDRLRDVIAVMEQCAVHCSSNGIKLVFIPGDLFDHKHPDGATLVAVSRQLHRMASEHGLEVYILPGNHDAVDRDGKLYTLQFYGELNVPGIRVMGHEVMEITEGLRVHAMPWLPDERAAKRIHALSLCTDKSGRDILLFHQTMKGAIADNGHESSHGLVGVTRAFDLAISGHFHHPQHHDWGMYLGSPLHIRFSDAADDRGFWTVNLGSKKLVPVMVPTTFPRFGQDNVRLDDGDELDELVNIEESASGLAYLKLRIEGPATMLERAKPTYMDWKGRTEALGLRQLVVELVPDRVTRSRMDVPASFTFSAMVDRYVEAAAAPGLDPATLRRIGAEAVEAASTHTKTHS